MFHLVLISLIHYISPLVCLLIPTPHPYSRPCCACPISRLHRPGSSPLPTGFLFVSLWEVLAVFSISALHSRQSLFCDLYISSNNLSLFLCRAFLFTLYPLFINEHSSFWLMVYLEPDREVQLGFDCFLHYVFGFCAIKYDEMIYYMYFFLSSYLSLVSRVFFFFALLCEYAFIHIRVYQIII